MASSVPSHSAVAGRAPDELVPKRKTRAPRLAISAFDRFAATIATLPVLVTICLVIASFWMSFQPSADTPAPGASFNNYHELFGSGMIGAVFINTVVFAAVSVIVSGALGGISAWLVARTDIPGKGLIRTLMTVNLILPGYVVAMGWQFLFADRIGSINALLGNLPFGARFTIHVTNPVGMGVVQGFGLAALFFIMLVDAFRSANPSLEEAAQVHGMGKSRVILGVVLPLAMPSILAAAFYTAIVAVAAFDVPAIIGLSGRTLTLSTYLYLLIEPGSDGPPDYGVAAATGVLIIAVTTVPMILYQRLLARSYKYAVIGGKGYRPHAIRLSVRTKVSVWLFLGLYFLFAQLLPLLDTIWVSLQPYMRPISIAGFADISLAGYYSLSWPLVMLGFRNTAVLMVASPTVAILLGVFIAWTVIRSKFAWRGLYDYFAFLPLMVPSVVFALSVLLIGLFVVPGLGLYGTIYAIMIVYVVMHISFATRNLNGILVAINTELDEVASVHGMGSWWRLSTIILPLLVPTIASTWLWLALLSYRELTVASFLATHDNITLSAVVWSSWTSGGTSLAATITVIGVLIMAPIIAFYWWVNHRFFAGRAEEG
jgi:iron(III) transport system permease protein